MTTYSPQAFVAWPAWDDVEHQLASPGGACCGLGGARGAGKTWLLKRAVDQVRAAGGIGIYFSSPRNYEPVAFLAALCAALATNVRDACRPPDLPFAKARDWLTQWPVRGALALAALGLGALAVDGGIEAILDWLPVGAFGGALALLYGAAPFIRRTLYIQRFPEFRLFRQANELLRWLQFSTIAKTTTEGGLTVGQGAAVHAKVAGEVTRNERPVAELMLVAEFRALAEAVTASGLQLVVAVDELDKLDRVEDLRTLLRDVKGVLDPTGVVLLVALSDEAVNQVGMGGLRGRDEINSSFATTLSAPPLTGPQAAELVAARLGRPLPKVAAVLDVITAGNTREIARLLDLYARGGSPDGTLADDPRRCVSLVLEVETRELLAGLLAEPSLGDTTRLGAYRWITEHLVGADRLADLTITELLAQWDPLWAGRNGDTWPADVAELWRRFLLYAASARLLWQLAARNGALTPHADVIDQLRRMNHTATTSAEVARYIGETELEVLDSRK